MARAVTFGEIMLRLAPEGYYRFIQADRFGATYGGGEANVAASLAQFGLDAAFVTKLPENEIGQGAVNYLRRFGVDTGEILRGGDRIGIYFLEKGASQRASKVIYDRAYSSIATATADDFDWERIFNGVNWFHFTGITPALGDGLAEICHVACKCAKEKGITISCDLNFRKNLWSEEKAGRIMADLMGYVDIFIANEGDAANLFGIRAKGADANIGEVSHEGCMSTAEQLLNRFGFSQVAFTMRESISANDNNWAGMLYDGKEWFFSEKYPVHIVDRVGCGDSFAAGLIYASLANMSTRDIVEFAAAAGCLKHSVEGDFNMVSEDEVRNIVGGQTSGRIQR